MTILMPYHLCTIYDTGLELLSVFVQNGQTINSNCELVSFCYRQFNLLCFLLLPCIISTLHEMSFSSLTLKKLRIL